jgi:phosphoribosylanthranilate isomerase
VAVVEVKFCGLTRSEDAAQAAALGARYAGFIFAGGPRERTPSVAVGVLSAAPPCRRVGVFGADALTRIPATVSTCPLDVVQLHADPGPADVAAVRRVFDGAVWAVVRVEGDAVPTGIADLFAAADAVVLDARAPGGLGGSGRAFDWAAVARRLPQDRGATALVLAGGLRPENVQDGIRAIGPDIVDVSSGVESAPGIKDHARMAAFMRAAAGAEA